MPVAIDLLSFHALHRRVASPAAAGWIGEAHTRTSAIMFARILEMPDRPPGADGRAQKPFGLLSGEHAGDHEEVPN